MKSSPLLSIGIIFKNEARCIERCLKSLEPLRRAIPCEVVMADTGAEDGSREIAQRYADILFDFPWIGDFSAARNAVMDRCTGKWYLTFDCDEWLDADISELVAFVTSKNKHQLDFGFVIQRNYFSLELEQSESYNDFHALRMVRMSTGNRYYGAIHESFNYTGTAAHLTHTILHHDGYCLEDPEDRKAKSRRNMELLHKELDKMPNDLRVLLQCIESESQIANRIQYIRSGIELLQKDKIPGAGYYGPVILSHAAENSRLLEMEERDEWIQFALMKFPHSIFSLVDVNYSAAMAAYDAKEWEKAIQHSEEYRKGIAAYRSDPPSPEVLRELGAGILRSGNAAAERVILMGLADAYLHCSQGEKALQILSELDFEKLENKQLQNTVVALSQLHAQTTLDISPVLTQLYDQIDKKETDVRKQKARRTAFNTIAAAAFTEKYQKEEQKKEGYWRPAYTAFLCLADRCEAGRGAAILQTNDSAEIRQCLLQVEDWQALPIEALKHAIRAGVPFPLTEKPLGMEVLDGLAAQLTSGENFARQLVLKPVGTLKDPYWEQSLVLAALRSFDWTQGKYNKPASPFFCPKKPEKEDEEDQRPQDTPEIGLDLLRRFSQMESNLLPQLYAAPMLTEENAARLPPMHCWGLYCTWAFQALDDGRPQEYLATLRRGLTACPGQKEIVQFLLDRFLEDARPQTNPELLALAEKIRTILSAYSPNDPAVAVIRQSPAYQQVAWLIEDSPSRLLQ